MSPCHPSVEEANGSVHTLERGWAYLRMPMLWDLSEVRMTQWVEVAIDIVVTWMGRVGSQG